MSATSQQDKQRGDEAPASVPKRGELIFYPSSAERSRSPGAAQGAAAGGKSASSPRLGFKSLGAVLSERATITAELKSNLRCSFAWEKLHGVLIYTWHRATHCREAVCLSVQGCLEDAGGSCWFCTGVVVAQHFLHLLPDLPGDPSSKPSCVNPKRVAGHSLKLRMGSEISPKCPAVFTTKIPQAKTPLSAERGRGL